ncbi:hypothetical protein JXA32_13770 [Candidatus Sumerlaeota bacterium]|nr:hypothetical protein [Candidatus Sumerlaeota bacterium]
MPRATAQGIYCPDQVATIVFDGIDSSGPSESGVVGIDEEHSLIIEIGAPMDLPTGVDQPGAPNQITMARYYGDAYPGYYDAADAAEVDAITDLYGGGIPRYAAIMAKFCAHVMERSGARQINVAGASMGAYVARWMIENDYEGLASSGRIARFITLEGVVCGNWICSQGGSLADLLDDDYDIDTIDVEQMDYDWLEANLHNPRTEMDSPLYANMIVMHWISTDDDLYESALTLASGEANDGIGLCVDAYFHEVTERSKYFGQRPTKSFAYATHDSLRDYPGIRAGLAADLTSTRRVRVTLQTVRVTDLPESAIMGEGEAVFGCEVYSPRAATRFGVTDPVNRIDYLGRTIELIELDEDEDVAINQQLFDDFVLPGEQTLRLEFDVREIDNDYFYGIIENPFGDDTEELDSDITIISTLSNGSYVHESADWRGEILVEVIDYPPFILPASAQEWEIYP